MLTSAMPVEVMMQSDSPNDIHARWKRVPFLVGREYVATGMRFYRSMRYWQCGEINSRREWTHHIAGNQLAPIAAEQPAGILIEGDCRGPITLRAGGLIHVLGDLHSDISIGDQGEIVIGGNCYSGSVLYFEGIQNLFVVGDVDGEVRSAGSLQGTINGSSRGTIRTGRPSTHLRVGGDLLSQIEPYSDAHAALLYLDVCGYMPFQHLSNTSENGYTQFDANVGLSDCEPGIYPDAAGFFAGANQRKFRTWTIQNRRMYGTNTGPTSFEAY